MWFLLPVVLPLSTLFYKLFFSLREKQSTKLIKNTKNSKYRGKTKINNFINFPKNNLSICPQEGGVVSEVVTSWTLLWYPEKKLKNYPHSDLTKKRKTKKLLFFIFIYNVIYFSFFSICPQSHISHYYVRWVFPSLQWQSSTWEPKPNMVPSPQHESFKTKAPKMSLFISIFKSKLFQ